MKTKRSGCPFENPTLVAAIIAFLIFFPFLGRSAAHGSPPDEGSMAAPADLGHTSASAGAKPNVLLITIDTLRADYVGAFGNGWIHTPTLDGLAQQGARFSLDISNFPQTNPSHASILTGVYPSTHGLKHHFVDHIVNSVPTFAEAMASQGYVTAGIFSWPSFEPQYSGLDRGFSYYKGAYVPVPGQTDIERAFDGHADVTTNVALQWLANKPSQPYFLWIHYMDPHFPYTPPPPYNWIYDPCQDCVDGSYNTIDQIVGGRVLSDKDILHLKALYAGEVSFTDQEIGRLLSVMRSNGDLNNTIIVVTGDHGESFDENGRWFHPSILYDTVEHVPLIIIYPPAITPGTNIKSVTQSIDIMPTVLTLIGAPIPSDVEGKDLMPLVTGQDTGESRAAFTETVDEASTSMVSNDWKLIRNNLNGTLELYDLSDDPGELFNQAAARPDVAASMEQQLEAWMDAHGITYN